MTKDQLLERLIEHLVEALGTDLASVILYGSAVTGDYQEKVSDLNILCIVKRIGTDELRKLNKTVRWWSKRKKQPVPIFLSCEEIKNAHDAFAIEFLDIRAAYRVLHGEDLVENIEIDPVHHRYQVEHELRQRLLRLREHYVSAQNDRRALADLLVQSLPSFATLFRHALILKGNQPPSTKREIFQRAAEQFSISEKPFKLILDFRQGTERIGAHAIHPVFDDYLLQITKAAEVVDRL